MIAALTVMALSAAALAQKSSGHMDLDDISSDCGVQLAAFRVMISKTDAICPQQTGLFRIARNGRVTDIMAILWSYRVMMARLFGTWTYRPFPPPMTSLTGGVSRWKP